MKLDTVEQIEERLQVLWTLQEGINDIIVSLRDRQMEINSASVEGRIAGLNPETFLDYPQWGDVTQDTYGKIVGWFDKNYMNKGLYRSGSHPETRQAVLSIKLDQNLPLEAQLGILDFLPYIKPGKLREYDEEEMVYFDIFEHTCSQRCSYSLRMNPQKTRFWVQTHYGNVESESIDLIKAMSYIYSHHPYQLKKGTEYDEDDDY